MKDRKTQIMLMVGAAILVLMASLTSPAQAADVSVGAGVGFVPDYEGSDESEAVPLPYVNARWANHRSINLLGNKAKANLIPSPFWRGGVVGEFIAERDDVDNRQVDLLDDVDTAIMLGAFFGFQYNNWSADIEAMTDVADGNDGSIVRLNGGYRIPVDQALNLSLGLFTTWADDDYMEAYFGINPVNAARSGLRTFKAESGFKDVGLNFRASYQPWQKWGLMGMASFKRLLGDAEDSPVVADVGDDTQFTGGLLVFYKF